MKRDECPLCGSKTVRKVRPEGAVSYKCPKCNYEFPVWDEIGQLDEPKQELTDYEKATKKERERILSIIGEAYILNSKVAQNSKNRDDFLLVARL